MEIQQKQPSGGVIRKSWSENMQQIGRRTTMSKCEFNKFHFGMRVLLHIKFAACIFSEHIFLRTPVDGYFWYRPFSMLSSCIWKGVNLHVVETKLDKKFSWRSRKRVGVKIKCHYILPWTNRVTSGPYERSEISRVFIKNLSSWFLTLEFPQTNNDRDSIGSGKSGKDRNFVRGSGKSQGRKFLSMQIFNFNKSHMHTEICAFELYIWCYYLHLVSRWL